MTIQWGRSRARHREPFLYPHLFDVTCPAVVLIADQGLPFEKDLSAFADRTKCASTS